MRYQPTILACNVERQVSGSCLREYCIRTSEKIAQAINEYCCRIAGYLSMFA
jgi:hypothetical protein